MATRKVYKLGSTMYHQTLHEDHMRVMPKSLCPLMKFRWWELGAEITRRNSTILLYLCQKGIMEIYTGDEMLRIFVIQLWLMYLRQLYLSRGSEHLYRFIDPLPLQTIGPIVNCLFFVHKTILLQRNTQNIGQTQRQPGSYEYIFNDNVASFLDGKINDIRQPWT
ncbi:hypothetical protein CR513_12121, partial [Mucuna pruriens]